MRHQLFELGVAAHQPRPGEAVLQIMQQLFRIVAQQNGADALLAGRHQQRAQRRLGDGEADFFVRAAGAIAGLGVMPSSDFDFS